MKVFVLSSIIQQWLALLQGSYLHYTTTYLEILEAVAQSLYVLILWQDRVREQNLERINNSSEVCI